MIKIWELLLLLLTFHLIFLKSVAGSDKKGCLLADQTFPESIFPSHACWKCYENLIDKGRLIKVGCKIIHERQNYTVPGFVVDADCVPFDHRDKSISALVQRSLTNSTFEKWQKCCNEAINCCHMMIKSYQVENFLNTCDAHFSIDGNCFLDTRPGMNVKKMCPFHLTRYDSSKCNHFYTKECKNDGSWNPFTDYSQCLQNKRQTVDTIWHISILGLSLVVCMPPMFTFLLGKSLRSKCLMMILGLIVAIGCRNLFILLSKCFITLNHLTSVEPSIVDHNLWSCKIFTFFVELSRNFVYFAMLFLAFHLHQAITTNFPRESFRKGTKRVFFAGIVLTIGTTLIWAVSMELTTDKLCWITDSHLNWINDGCKVIMHLATLILLIHIVWHHTGHSKARDGIDLAIFITKFLIMCFPAFWLPFIIILINTLNISCGWEVFNKFLMIICEAFQAILISAIFLLAPSVRQSIAKAFTRKMSESDASLAPRNSINKDTLQEPMSDWNQVVARARNSICGDAYSISSSIETHSPVSITPEPSMSKNRSVSIISQPSIKTITTPTHRPTIRSIMLRAKNNLQPNGSVASCSSGEMGIAHQPAKNIPNQILDDVQLFDFYYKNLDSIFIANNSSAATNSSDEGPHEPQGDRRGSITKIRRMLSLTSDKPPNPKKLLRMLSFDEQRN